MTDDDSVSVGGGEGGNGLAARVLFQALTIMSGFFSHVPLEPPNSILGVAMLCKQDGFADKIDLTIGAYRNEQGRPDVLACVRDAETIVHSQRPDHEYLGQDGLPEFTRCSQILLFGSKDCNVLAENRVYSIQGISGTGSLRLACDFISTHMPERTVYIPEVTWPNHPTMLAAAHCKQATYRYLTASGVSLDFGAMLADITAAPEGASLFDHLRKKIGLKPHTRHLAQHQIYLSSSPRTHRKAP